VDQWGEKAYGMAVRIAAVLELFKCASEGTEGARIFRSKISRQSMEWAVQIMKALEDHYLRVMVPRPEEEIAEYVLLKLDELGRSKLQKRTQEEVQSHQE